MREASVDWDVTLRRDAEGALRALRDAVLEGEHLPDLLILDVGLDGMDGTEFLRRLRMSEALCALDVVVLSGILRAKTVDECSDLGARDFYLEPTDFVEMVGVIKHIETERLKRVMAEH